ncbi:MAG: type VI secretion system lipoprotein TssJ [Pseudomonadota bacterium]
MLLKLKLFLTATLTMFALAACAPTATSVSSNVVAASNLNGGLPAKATIFYLASTSSFNSATYAALSGDAQAALGADLLGKQDVLLSPGDTKTVSRSFDGEGPAAVGVIVGFKALTSSQWRASTSVSGGKANALTVSIGSGSVKISK